jgi:hypothetical protein
MWRTRRELLRSCVSFFILLACLAVCSIIIASRWHDEERSPVARAPTDAPVAIVRFSDLQGADVAPAIYQTGTIARPVDLRR